MVTDNCDVQPVGCNPDPQIHYSDATVKLDSDDDLVRDSLDNCPNDYNPWQEDFDGYGLGYVCDDTCAVTMDFSHTFMDAGEFELFAGESIDFDGTLEHGSVVSFNAPGVNIHPSTDIHVGSIFVVANEGCMPP